jgi:hypothetical protein
MSPETAEHKQIKEIVSDFLKNQYGVALQEYPDSGNIQDVKAVTNDGISIFVENVWTSKKGNFQRDLNILHRSTAKVKIFVANSAILHDRSLVRDFEKTQMTEREKGFQVSAMIDGSRILADPDYVKNDFSKTVAELVAEARGKKSNRATSQTTSQSQLKHSKHILLTRSDYQGLDHWAKANLIENLLLHSNDKLETKSLMQHFETGYFDQLWSPLIEYKSLMEKHNYLVVPFPPRFQEAIGGYGKSLSDAFESTLENDKKRLLKLKQELLNAIDQIIFEVQNGRRLKGRCDFCP